MTPDQKRLLIEAADKGDDIRIVTIALQIGAHAARERRQDDAIAIRRLVDIHQSQESAEIIHRQKRLEIVTRIYGLKNMGVEDAITIADSMIDQCAKRPVPGTIDEPHPPKDAP